MLADNAYKFVNDRFDYCKNIALQAKVHVFDSRIVKTAFFVQFLHS